MKYNYLLLTLGVISFFSAKSQTDSSKTTLDEFEVTTTRVGERSPVAHENITKEAISKARELIENLKELIPRQMFEISIQGCIGSKVLASTSVRGFRKDVTAKLYGGDATRKMKLLKKQKEGKKKMKKIGNVEIPKEAFYEFMMPKK